MKERSAFVSSLVTELEGTPQQFESRVRKSRSPAEDHSNKVWSGGLLRSVDRTKTIHQWRQRRGDTLSDQHHLAVGRSRFAVSQCGRNQGGRLRRTHGDDPAEESWPFGRMEGGTVQRRFGQHSSVPGLHQSVCAINGKRRVGIEWFSISVGPCNILAQMIFRVAQSST